MVVLNIHFKSTKTLWGLVFYFYLTCHFVSTRCFPVDTQWDAKSRSVGLQVLKQIQWSNNKQCGPATARLSQLWQDEALCVGDGEKGARQEQQWEAHQLCSHRSLTDDVSDGGHSGTSLHAFVHSRECSAVIKMLKKRGYFWKLKLSYIVIDCNVERPPPLESLISTTLGLLITLIIWRWVMSPNSNKSHPTYSTVSVLVEFVGKHLKKLHTNYTDSTLCCITLWSKELFWKRYTKGLDLILI